MNRKRTSPTTPASDRRSHPTERGIALMAAIVGLILISSAVAGIFLLARQAELAAEPASRRAELQAFAADGVRFCARVLGVLAGEDPDGILDLDTLVSVINSDPNHAFDVVLNSSADVSRLPKLNDPVQGDNALEQKFYAVGDSAVTGREYEINVAWALDRDASGRYRPPLELRRGAFVAGIDLDPVGPLGGQGGGGLSGVIESGRWRYLAGPDCSGADCEGGGGGAFAAEAEAAGNPAAGRVASNFWYRCRVDAHDTTSGAELVADTLIRR